MASGAATRVLAVDWLRGLAVIFMIQTHSLVLLLPGLRKGALFDALQWIDGLVAPSFILAAGFSMALTQVRAAAAQASPETRRQRMRKTLRRLGEVLAVATLVNWMWFPIFREPRFILRMDILQCIGFSLLIALPILFSLARRPRALQLAALLLACAAFGIAPLTESLGPPWAGFLNRKNDAVFPLLPWAGYVYLGAVIGAATAQHGRRGAARWLLALAVVGVVLWVLTPWIATAYPPHEFWVTNPANHARRWTQVCLFALLLLGLEQGLEGSWRTSMPIRFIEVFGTSSLAGYFFHETLLFFRIFGFSFEARWGNSATWSGYLPLLLLLLVATFALTWLTDRVYRSVDRRFASPPAKAALG